MLNKLTINDIEVASKTIFLRVDLNAPLDKSLNITDFTRIEAIEPTVKNLLDRGAKVCLFSHLGRPKNGFEEKFSLKNILSGLEKTLNIPVKFCSSLADSNYGKVVNSMNDGELMLMENVRFYKEETENDIEFSRLLANPFDLYVNDAFGTCHRAHASTNGVAKNFDKTACGFLISKEIEYLEKAVSSPDRPFTAIIGGAKVQDKIKVISNLLDKADKLLIGGGMAYTFLAYLGHTIGNSLNQLAESEEIIKGILKKAETLNKEILLPVDHVIASEFAADAKNSISPIDIPDGKMGLDIGPETIKKFSEIIALSKTVIWNGPMGVFEMPAFQKGTFAIAEKLAESSATTIIGGGDSASAINQSGLSDKISHISTGGGACLEFLEGKPLPGIEVLSDK